MGPGAQDLGMGESTREFWDDATVLYFECDRASDSPCVKTHKMIHQEE